MPLLGGVPEFTVQLRGYQPAAVDRLARLASGAVSSDDPSLRAAVLAELRQRDVPIQLRGYHTGQVDDYLSRVEQALAEEF